MLINSEIIEINSRHIESARLLASALKDSKARKRGFVDLLGIFLAKGYLSLKGIETDSSKSIFKITPLYEEFKINDIYYNNYRIDVVTLYKEKTVKIPKIHVDMDILPDYYFVVQIGSKVKEAKMIGFINQRSIFSSPCDNKYYYPSMDDIFDIEQFISLTKIMAPVKPIPTRHKETMELFLKFMDNELPSAYKRQLIKHLLDCPRCRQHFTDTLEFEKLANNITKFPSLIEKYKNKAVPISVPANNVELKNDIENSLNNLNIQTEVEKFDDIEEKKIELEDNLQDEFYEGNLEDLDGNEPVRAVKKKRNFVSYDRKVDDYGYDDTEYKTSSTYLDADIPAIDDDYDTIDNLNLDEIAKLSSETLDKEEKETTKSDVVKEYIKDVIQKTIKETIEENLKDAVKEEKLASTIEEEINKEVQKELSQIEPQQQDIDEQKEVVEDKKEEQEEKQEEKEEEKRPSILDDYKKPKPIEIIEPEPRKIEIIEYNPPKKEEQEILEPRKIELIEFTNAEVEVAKNENVIKSIKDESIIEIKNQLEKQNKEILLTPSGKELSEIVKTEAIEEIFEDAKKLELNKSNRRSGRKRFLIASIMMLVVLVAIGIIAINGTSNIVDKNNDIQNVEELQADDGFDAQTLAYNNASDNDYELPKNSKINAIDDLLIKQPLPKASYAPEISKISWEAPESLVKRDDFTKFLQLMGKNIKLNLQNELLLVNDIPVNKTMKVDIKIAPTGDVVGVSIAATSGSVSIDNTVKKVVSDTVKYNKPPNLGFRVQNTTITLTIGLS